MSYTKQNFIDGDILYAKGLNAMDNEISNLSTTINNLQREKFTNISVPSSAFISDTTYSDFPYRASIALTEVTNDMFPEIIFSIDSLNNNNFAPVAETYNGGVYIYAEELPTATITIPTIICWR